MTHPTPSVSLAAQLARLMQKDSALDVILQQAVDGLHRHFSRSVLDDSPSLSSETSWLEDRRDRTLHKGVYVDSLHTANHLHSCGVVDSCLFVQLEGAQSEWKQLERVSSESAYLDNPGVPDHGGSRQQQSSVRQWWTISPADVLTPPDVQSEVAQRSFGAIAPLIQQLENAEVRQALLEVAAIRFLPSPALHLLVNEVAHYPEALRAVWQDCCASLAPEEGWMAIPIVMANQIVGFWVAHGPIADAASYQVNADLQQILALVAIAIHTAALKHQLHTPDQKQASQGQVFSEPKVEPQSPDAFQAALQGAQRTEAQLQRREEIFQLMFEHAPIGMTMSDTAGHFFAVNRAFGKQLGYEPSTLLGKTCHDLTYPDGEDTSAQIFEQFRRSDRSYIQYEKTYATRQGKPLRALINLGVIRDAAGDPLYFICQSYDISQQRQFESTLRRQAQQERVARLMLQRIRQTLNIDSILSTAVRELRQLLGVDRVVIYQFLPDGSGVVNHEAVSHPSWSILHRIIYDPCFNGSTKTAYLQGRYAAIADIRNQALVPCYRDLLEQLDVRAVLVLPLMQNVQVPAAAPKLWGLFIAHHCSGAHHWGASDIDLMRQISDQLAIAIEQAELYHQVLDLNNTLELQVEKRTCQIAELLNFEGLLRRITTNIRESLDEDQIIAAAVEALKTTLGGRSCDCAIYDEAAGTATIRYEATDESYSVQGAVSRLVEFDDLMPDLQSGQCIQFCERYPRPMVVGWQPRAVLACPIRDNQTILGDLWLFRAAHQTFNPMEIRLVKQVADQCAIAIRQSRLYRTAQTQVEELRKLNQLKDDFLSTVSHELRTPMASIKVAVDLLEMALMDMLPSQAPVWPKQAGDRAPDANANSNAGGTEAIGGTPGQTHLETDRSDRSRLDGSPDAMASIKPSSRLLNLSSPSGIEARLEQYLYILKHECKREINLIDDLLDLSRLDADTEPLMLSQLRLQDWLPHVAYLFDERLAQRQQQLHLDVPPDLPALTTDFSYFERIFSELLQNACKYTGDGETIQVRVCCLPIELTSMQPVFTRTSTTAPPPASHFTSSLPSERESFQLTISNSGVEIPFEERDRIFDKFYRIPNSDPWKNPGTGLGLALVRKLTEHLHGTITVDTTPGWTHFIVQIPSLLL